MIINYVFIGYGFLVVLSTRKPGVVTPTGYKDRFLGGVYVCACSFLTDLLIILIVFLKQLMSISAVGLCGQILHEIVL